MIAENESDEISKKIKSILISSFPSSGQEKSNQIKSQNGEQIQNSKSEEISNGGDDEFEDFEDFRDFGDDADDLKHTEEANEENNEELHIATSNDKINNEKEQQNFASCSCLNLTNLFPEEEEEEEEEKEREETTNNPNKKRLSISGNQKQQKKRFVYYFPVVTCDKLLKGKQTKADTQNNEYSSSSSSSRARGVLTTNADAACAEFQFQGSFCETELARWTRVLQMMLSQASKASSGCGIKDAESGARSRFASFDEGPNGEAILRKLMEAVAMGGGAAAGGVEGLMRINASVGEDISSMLIEHLQQGVTDQRMMEMNQQLMQEVQQLEQAKLDAYRRQMEERAYLERKMEIMRLALEAETQELMRQERAMEIDRFEAIHHPEPEYERAELNTGDDEFTRKMRKEGYQYKGKDNEVKVVRADALPKEFSLADFSQMPVSGDDDDAGEQKGWARKKGIAGGEDKSGDKAGNQKKGKEEQKQRMNEGTADDQGKTNSLPYSFDIPDIAQSQVVSPSSERSEEPSLILPGLEDPAPPPQQQN